MGERGIQALGGDRHLASQETQLTVAQQRPGHEAGLGEDLEAVADAEDEPALARERRHRPHDRTEPRDHAGAQVVAVRESAGEDDRGDAVERRLLVPQLDGLRAGQGEGVDRVAVAVAAGEDDHADAHRHQAIPPIDSIA